MKMVDDDGGSVGPAAPASPINPIREKPDYLREMKGLAREMMAKATILIGIVIAVAILALLFAAMVGLRT